MTRKLTFALLTMAALATASCSSTTHHSGQAGGGEWSAFDSMLLVGQQPAGDDDPIPQIDLVGEGPAQPVRPPEPVQPVQPVQPRVDPPDPVIVAPQDDGADRWLDFYDALSNAADDRPKGPLFNPTAKSISDAVERFTRNYSRLLQKLNPGF